MPRARVILGFLGTLAAIALALWLIDWRALLAAFAHLSPGVLLLSAVFSIATALLLAGRWAILAARPGDRIGPQEFHDALVGQAFNLITPAALGADAYRVVMAGGREGGRTPAMAMLALERLLGFVAYAAAFLLSFAVGVDDLANETMGGVAIFFAGTLVVLAVLFVAARYPAWHGMGLPDFFALARAREAMGQVVAVLVRRGADAGQPRHVVGLSRHHRRRQRRELAGARHRRDRRGNRMRAAAPYFDPGHRSCARPPLLRWRSRPAEWARRLLPHARRPMPCIFC
jgi:uncharacterized membrane protein YbhN (UPF0104 family)